MIVQQYRSILLSNLPVTYHSVSIEQRRYSAPARHRPSFGSCRKKAGGSFEAPLRASFPVPLEPEPEEEEELLAFFAASTTATSEQISAKTATTVVIMVKTEPLACTLARQVIREAQASAVCSSDARFHDQCAGNPVDGEQVARDVLKVAQFDASVAFNWPSPH
jgi:hypothetical protein